MLSMEKSADHNFTPGFEENLNSTYLYSIQNQNAFQSPYKGHKTISPMNKDATSPSPSKSEEFIKRFSHELRVSYKGSDVSTEDTSNPSLCMDDHQDYFKHDEDLFEQLTDSSRKYLGYQSKEASPEKTDFQHIFPTFRPESKQPSHYIFMNQNRTLIHDDTISFSTIFADQPLPNYGKYKFSVRIDECKKAFPKLYVGVCTEDLKGKELRYHPDYYFMSAFSSHSFLNRLILVKENILPRKGQIITVLVDLDNQKISFEIDGIQVLSGRLSMPKGKLSNFYPFICIGEPRGSVTCI